MDCYTDSLLHTSPSLLEEIRGAYLPRMMQSTRGQPQADYASNGHHLSNLWVDKVIIVAIYYATESGRERKGGKYCQV